MIKKIKLLAVVWAITLAPISSKAINYDWGLFATTIQICKVYTAVPINDPNYQSNNHSICKGTYINEGGWKSAFSKLFPSQNKDWDYNKCIIFLEKDCEALRGKI